MLDNKGFDLWADGYDRSVADCEKENEYPFAGYKKVLGTVYRHIREVPGKKVLDVGFGTGTLLTRLYDEGYEVYGFDFSEKMVDIARRKMPRAHLVQHDIAKGLPAIWAGERFHFIACTYAIHHIPYDGQTALMEELMHSLLPGGRLLIGDVAFDTVQAMEDCRAQCGDMWDEEEYYPILEKLQADFPGIRFEQQSFCAGVFMLQKSP